MCVNLCICACVNMYEIWRVKGKAKHNSPWLWNNPNPMKFTRRPAPPTISSNCGFSIFSTCTSLFNASTRIEKHNAIRNTEFTKAPRTSARAQPNVFFWVRHLEIWNIKSQYWSYVEIMMFAARLSACM